MLKSPASQQSSSARGLSRQLRRCADPKIACILQGFFKTAPGDYGHGDIFLGIKVPTIRALVKRYRHMPPGEAERLVKSKYHEERLAGLLVWVDAFNRGTDSIRETIFSKYLQCTRWINNWDLVDLSAPHIVGGFVDPKDMGLLNQLARSDSLWERRVAVLATMLSYAKGALNPA